MRTFFSLMIVVCSFFSQQFVFAQGGAGAPAKQSSSAAMNEEIEALVEELVDERLDELYQEKQAQEQEKGLLYSKRGLDLRLGGGLEVEWKQAERNSRPGTPASPHSVPYGLDLDKAAISLEGSYYERNSDWSLIDFKIEAEFNEKGAKIDEAYLIFNRPFTRTNVPLFGSFLREETTDNLLIGLENVFWKNDLGRISESYSLLENALARDERLMAQYTFTFFDAFYAILGVSNGSTLAVSGQVDESDNFMILEDDREAHFDSLDDRDAISRSMEVQGGAGFFFSWDEDRGEIINPEKPFRPHELAMQKNLFHLQTWWSFDRLSTNERNLLLKGTEGSLDGGAKWRFGVNTDFALEVDSRGHHTFFARYEFAHARDGDFHRTFWTLEASFAINLEGQSFPGIDGIQPFLRFSEVDTNRPGPVVTSTVSADDLEGAQIAADRRQINAGALFKLHRNVSFIFEYSWNQEDFENFASDFSGVDNDLYLLQLRIRW